MHLSSTTCPVPAEQAPRSNDRNKRMQARITEMFKHIQPEVELNGIETSSYHEEQRQRGYWGQDKDGLYFLSPDGRKQYKHM